MEYNCSESYNVCHSEMSQVESMLGGFITEADQKHRELSHLIIKAWTNFAKTG